MLKVKRIAAVAGICTLLLTQAMAGDKYVETVIVGATYFSGSMGSARASSDSVQYIGCFMVNGEGGNCYARDAAGTTKMCYWTNPNFLRTVESINPASSIYVTFSKGICTYINVGNFSFNRPMSP